MINMIEYKHEGVSVINEILTLIRAFFSLLGCYLSFAFGSLDKFLYTLLFMMFLDYLTGVLNAIVTHKLNSDIGFKGIVKKFMILLIVAVANVLDGIILDTHEVLRTSIIFFYIANEGISLLENAAVLGLPIPEKIKQTLEKLNNND